MVVGKRTLGVLLVVVALFSTGTAIAAVQGIPGVGELPAITPSPPDTSAGTGGSPGPGQAPAPPPDEDAPVVAILSPRAGSTSAEARPAVAFSYEDASGISRESVQIFVDGVALGASAAYTRAAAFPEKDLAPGFHRVDANVADVHGNVARLTWSFYVAEAPEKQAHESAPMERVALTIPGLAMDAITFGPLRFSDGPSRAPILTPLVAPPASPRDVRVLAAFDLSPAESGVGRAMFDIVVREAWLDAQGADANRLVLLHFTRGAWEARALTSFASANGERSYQSNVGSFSPFALVVDVEAPLLALTSGLDNVAAGEASQVFIGVVDSGGIRTFTLALDGAPMGGSLEAGRIVGRLPATDPGTHTLEAVVTDFAGNTAAQSWQFSTLPNPLAPPVSAPGEEEPAPSPTTSSTNPGSAALRTGPWVGFVVAAIGVIAVGIALVRKR